MTQIGTLPISVIINLISDLPDFLYSLAILIVSVFYAWPKINPLLPMWSRKVQRLDTPAVPSIQHNLALCLFTVIVYFPSWSFPVSQFQKLGCMLWGILSPNLALWLLHPSSIGTKCRPSDALPPPPTALP